MLSMLYQDLEAFSFQLYSINADMEEHRKICICLESDGMLCVKNKLYLAVFRSTEIEDNQRVRLLANGEIKAGEPLFAVETVEE